MNIWLYVIIFILVLICILLIIKIINIKKALKEIEKSLNNILKTDTNNLITTSSSDKYIKNLTIIFNNELNDLLEKNILFSTNFITKFTTIYYCIFPASPYSSAVS